jgi:hypothetical protein
VPITEKRQNSDRRDSSCFPYVGEKDMATITDELLSKVKELSYEEKLRLVNAMLADLDMRDPKLDRIWAEQARKRWAAYKAGNIPTVLYEEVIAKHSR